MTDQNCTEKIKEEQQEQEVKTETDVQENVATEEVQDENVTVDPLVEIESLRAQIATLEAKAHEEKNKLMLAYADADNARKRAEQDVVRERKYGIEKFVKSLIPVYDSMEKALEYSDREDPATKNILDGVDATLQLFVKEMSNFGVEVLNPLGQPFNPEFHQAISMVESDQVAPNHVLAVMQKGIALNGRVVRAAMVVVAKEVAKPQQEDAKASIDTEA